MATTNQTTSLSTTPKKKWYHTIWGRLILLFIVFTCAGILIFGWYVTQLAKQLQTQNQNSEILQTILEKLKQPGPNVFNNDGRPHLGNPEAKIKIVEFFDFNCPYCRESYPIIRKISTQHKNDVEIILRNYPLIEESSKTLALAGECANEQGLFWNLHDNFFQTNAPAEKIILLAKKSGLNMTQFTSCLENQKYIANVNKDIMLAEQIGARGTPTWVINGHRFDGVIKYDIFEQIINALNQDL